MPPNAPGAWHVLGNRPPLSPPIRVSTVDIHRLGAPVFDMFASSLTSCVRVCTKYQRPCKHTIFPASIDNALFSESPGEELAA